MENLCQPASQAPNGPNGLPASLPHKSSGTLDCEPCKLPSKPKKKQRGQRRTWLCSYEEMAAIARWPGLGASTDLYAPLDFSGSCQLQQRGAPTELQTHQSPRTSPMLVLGPGSGGRRRRHEPLHASLQVPDRRTTGPLGL